MIAHDACESESESESDSSFSLLSTVDLVLLTALFCLSRDLQRLRLLLIGF